MAADARPRSTRSRKRRRVSFSHQHPELAEIARFQNDLETALRRHFSLADPSNHIRFAGYTPDEVQREMEDALEESGRRSSFQVLAAFEAALRIDFYQRSYARARDPLSRKLREMLADRGRHVRLEDILDAWKDHSTVPASLISELRTAFKYRHWLAHGRYWTLKLGRQHDYHGIFTLVETALDIFRLERLPSP